jgi:hypothetical protein
VSQIDLLRDADEYCFVESGIRGGMTFINTHHVVANTPRVPDTYSPNHPLIDLLYIDANNLYGNALSQKLPKSDFKWLEPEEFAAIDFSSVDCDGDVGYLLEVDLFYPPEVQDASIDLPYAPEKISISDNCLTEFMCKQWVDLNTGKERKYRGTPKLMLTHWDKTNYVVHCKLLKFYIQRGLQIVKIHRVLRFHQSAFFEPYISYNSQRRSQAVNTFEKDVYKRKNNSLFGKTMENVRKRMKFRLCTNEENLVSLASRPEFLSSTIFTDRLVGVHLSKEQVSLMSNHSFAFIYLSDLFCHPPLLVQVVLNKPIFIGQAVLDLSKLIMYELYYSTLVSYANLLGGRIEIVGGDTDSFFLKTTGINVETELLPLLCRDGVLDSSNYPTTHALFSNRYKAKLGCIKDEAAGKPFREWVLLRPKAYSMLTVDDEEKKRAKGVRRSTLMTEISHSDYRQAYTNQVTFAHSQRRIGSRRHQIYNMTYRKKSLSFFEDKRAWLEQNYSLPYGNHLLNGQVKPERKRAAVLPEIMEPVAKKQKF